MRPAFLPRMPIGRKADAMAELSKPIRQLAAVGLLLSALGATFTLLVAPGWNYLSGARAQIEDGRILLGRLQDTAGRRAELAELKRAADALPAEALTLKGDTEAIQLAGLQALVGELASAQGVRVTSARPLPAMERDGLRLVGLRFDVRADLEIVQLLVHRLETLEPLLVVQGLQIRSSAVPGFPAEQRDGVLDAAISIYGAQPPPSNKG